MNNIYDYGLNERFINESKLYPKFKIARIIAQYKNRYKIITKQGESFAEVSGKMKYQIVDNFEYPAVGDFVMLNTVNDTNIIQKILTRKSIFERKAVGSINHSQIIAANIDIAFLCMSLDNNYNLNRLERYISIAWDSGAIPIILLTKADKCKEVSIRLNQIENIAIGIDIIVCSAFDNKTIEKLNSCLKKGVTASFIGSSGVGKSTLINLLVGNEMLKTQEVNRCNKGRHTTTNREMFLLPNGAIVIDTPGMREIGIQKADIEKSFSDIEELIKECKFADCTHTSEPGCAIREAINNGSLEERRLKNYIKIKREATYEGLTAKERENAKLNEMFRDIGGMKKIKIFKKTIVDK